jgi:hypothetical protein
MFLLKIKNRIKSFNIGNKISIFVFKILHFIKNKSDWNLICLGGLGDTYMVCGLAEAILKTHGGRTFTIYVQKSHLFIPKLFPAITKVRIISKKQALNFRQNKFSIKKISYINLQSDPLASLIGNKNITIIDCYKQLFRIPQTSLISKPKKPTAEELEEAKKILSLHSMEQGKTAIIFYDARSSDSMSIELTKKICEELNKRNWNVIINSKDDNRKLIPKFISLEIPLELTRALANVSGWVIAVRSGIADLLSNSDCKLTILYPKIIWNGGKFIDGTSLKSMGLRKDVTELEITESDDFIKSIVN